MNTTALKVFYIILSAGLLAAGSDDAAAQAGLGPVQRTIDRTLEQRLPRVDDRLEDELRKKTEEADAAVESATQALPADDLPLPTGLPDPATTLSDAVTTVVDTASGVARAFAGDVDPFGNAIEKNTLVVLLDAQQLGALRAAGLNVIAERAMSGLGLTLVTLQASQAYGLADAALELQKSLPGAAVDFNHLYRFQHAEPVDVQDAATTAEKATQDTDAVLRIGLIDSGVAPDHSALNSVAVEARDFVLHDASRPIGHGTAVASVMSAASETPLSILSASVFFQTPGHAPGASTESLILALDWLVSEDVDAINMSLAGPANDLLERALVAIQEKGGPAVIAAVGNNGPAGEPMYPGAYDAVLGVTAVDRKQKIFRYANRGEHVDFAALGVNIKVANAAGGWRLESGTSMAAPRVAVIAGRMHREHGVKGLDLRAVLVSAAHDLGRPGFDPVFGYGLLSKPPTIVSSIKTSPQD